MTVIIHLTRGYEALVDDIDSDLAEMRWSPLFSGPNIYAICVKSVNKKSVSILMHRLILERMLGRELTRSEHVDHEKGDGLNNVRSNLRLATPQQNTRNKKERINSVNPYKGIAFYKRNNKWGGFISVDRKQVFLGLHTDPLEVHRRYCIAALTHFGQFANFGSNSPFTGYTLEMLQAPVIQLSLPMKVAA